MPLEPCLKFIGERMDIGITCPECKARDWYPVYEAVEYPGPKNFTTNCTNCETRLRINFYISHIGVVTNPEEKYDGP